MRVSELDVPGAIAHPPGTFFRDALADLLSDPGVKAEAARREGVTAEALTMATRRRPRSGEPSMTERALRKHAAAAGYGVAVVFVPAVPEKGRRS